MKKLLLFSILFFCSLSSYGQYKYIIYQDVSVTPNGNLGVVYAIYNGSEELFFERQSTINTQETIIFTSFLPVSSVRLVFGDIENGCGEDINVEIAPTCQPHNINAIVSCVNVNINNFWFFELDNLNNINDTSNPIGYCDVKTVKIFNDNSNCLGIDYAIEYFINNETSPIELIPYGPQFINFTFRPSDILGLNIGDNIRLRARYIDNTTNSKDYSDTIIYSIIACSPRLVQDPPEVVQPTCNDSNNGGFIAQFDRSLAADERMLLYVEKFNPNIILPNYPWDRHPISNDIDILDSSDINNTTSNTFVSPKLLESGTYRLKWLSKINPANGDLDPNEPEVANSAEESSEFIINEIPPITFSNATPIDASCYQGSDGSVTITNVQNGTAPYQYSKDNGVTWQGSPTFSGLSEDTYTLTVMDANGCLAQTPITVVIDAPQIAFTFDFDTVSQITQNGANDGSISVFVTGGTGNLTYNWTLDGAAYSTTTVNEINGLGPGQYGVTVIDENNCTATTTGNTTTILQEPPPLTVQFTLIQAIDCNGNTGIISAQGIGGNGAPYTYAWGNGSTNQQLANIIAGNYTITVTDSQGITINTSYNLVQPDELVVTPSQTNVSCFNETDATINLAIDGGTGDYTVVWTDDDTITTANRTGLSFGEYFYTVTDDNNCSVNSSVNITQPAALDITIDTVTDPTTVGGNNGAIDVTISGGTVSSDYIYLWTDASGSTIGTNQDIASLTDGNYTLLVTDDNNCTATITQRVTEPQPLSVDIIESVAISCPGSTDGQLTAEPFGGDGNYTVEWFIDNNGTFESLGVTSLIISNLSAGNYRVGATDGAGATAQFDYTLNDPIAIQVTENLTNINCFGGSDGAIDITVTGGTGNYTFTWTNSSGTVIGNNEDIADIPSGTYNVSVVDENLCDVFLSFELIAPTDPLTITIEQTNDPTAAGATDGFINVSVSGGTAPYTYQWTDSNGNVIATSEDLNDVGEGIYTLTVSDANFSLTSDNSGCNLVEDIPLLAPDAIIIAIDETASLLCNGDTNGVLTATVTGGFLNTGSDYTYQWFIDDNGTLVAINQTTAIASDLAAGTYTLTVTDDNTIQQNATYTLNQPDPLAIALTVTSNVSCDSGADGAISSIVSGGTGVYTYAWSNGETTANINGLTVDTYTLTITDANDCVASQSIEVTQPNGMTVTNDVIPPLCFGNSDGRISLSVSDGNSPYSYLWNTGATSSFIENLAAGAYSVTITDSQGCTIIQNFTVENPELLTLDLGEDRVLCTGQSLTIDATIDDLGASYNWTADNGFTNNEASVALSQDGIYTLTITNSNGCIATDSIAVSTTSEVISADFLVPTQAFVDEVIVAVDVSNPVPDAVTWSFDEGTTIVSQNGDYTEFKFAQEGVYTITMTTTKGSCQESLTKQIIVQPRTNATNQQDEQTAFIKTFKLYPNPSNGIFKTEIELKQEAPISIQIINLNANIVNTKTIKQANLEHIINHNLSEKPGTYIILLQTPKGNATKKIVVL